MTWFCWWKYKQYCLSSESTKQKYAHIDTRACAYTFACMRMLFSEPLKFVKIKLQQPKNLFLPLRFDFLKRWLRKFFVFFVFRFLSLLTTRHLSFSIKPAHKFKIRCSKQKPLFSGQLLLYLSRPPVTTINWTLPVIFRKLITNNEFE